MINETTRREFLLASAAGVAGLPALAARAADQRVPVIDTHLHCFAGSKDKRFPYHARAPYRPDDAATPREWSMR